MTPTALDMLMTRAIAAGVLPANTSAPTAEQRPWPVVLLTALGAWLAAVPLLGVVGLLLGDLMRRGVGPYAVGLLLLAAALVVLRSRALPLFIEQLAVPALLVGGGSLAFGLFRDLSVQGAAGTLAAVAIGVAAAVPRAWLRVLLGAAASLLAALALTPEHIGPGLHTLSSRLWLSWHLVLALCGLALALQAHVPARAAATLEPLAAGAVLATIAALAWWSGSTLLVGASAGDIVRALSAELHGSWQGMAMQAASAALAGAAAAWLGWVWPAVRQPWCAGAAAVCVALAAFMPALGAVLLVLAAGATSRRWRIAVAAAVVAAWIVGSFYYQLNWPLATKAIVLAVAGAALGGMAWLGSRGRPHPVAATPTQGGRPPRAWLGTVLTAAAVLAVANIGIWQKERLIAEGAPVFVELAPVDPRSLMQGDYMRLNFRIPGEVQDHLDSLLSPTRPRVLAQRDARGVATVLRLDDGAPLAADQLRIELTPKNGTWVLVSDAWFFKEGDAARWAQAKYAEFRVDPQGHALLVGLRDKELRRL